uniref:Polyprotein n=1 Tax=Strawberry latent ringspot virus TaxID=28351 RepID=A0A5K6SDZ7_9SECO|nr:polyprotein [Strawberry latent ringspot virus]AWO67819.1 polyprotein [Strawberry latent ringspot virus]
MASYFRRSTPEMPSVPSYTPKEMEVLKAAITECGINYADVVRAAQTESGKLAILTAANTHSLKSLVATTTTRSAFRRMSEAPKAVVHVSEGVGKQVLTDDKLTHQTTVVHTPKKVYDQMRSKKLKKAKESDEEEPKYRSADVCTIQLGVTSHLSGHSNQIAGVVLLDGNRSTQEQAVLGIGVLPLYEAHSHALFAPRLNIHYEDPNFVERLQLLTTFSDEVLGGGSPAMSYSTISVVRHNIADAHFLPEPLPYSKLKEKYPSGVKGLSNFQAAEIAPLQPARLTRSASYIPIQRSGAKTVLTFDDNEALLREQQPLQSRASFTFAGVSYGNQDRASLPLASTGVAQKCRFHNRIGCPCAQHTGSVEASGKHHEDLVPAAEGGTEGRFFSPQPVTHPSGSKFVGSHPFSFPINSNVGTIVCTLPITRHSLKDTEFGRFCKGYRYLRCVPTVRLVGSGPIQAKGLLWLCYDPSETLSKYPSRERALMLQGTWFLPGRHDSATLTVKELATPAGYCDMDLDVNGAFKVVIIKDLVNFDVSDYGMELSLYLEIEHIGLGKLVSDGDLTTFYPLRQMVLDYELTTTTAKGKALILPLDPLLPATDGAQFYPSCSSSILENHRYWRGTLSLEVIFNLPAMAGGIVELAFVYDSYDGAEGDIYRRFGSTVVDLRAHRILRARVPLNGYGGYFPGGAGSLFGAGQQAGHGDILKLAILCTAPLHISDQTKRGSVLVRYLGLEDLDYLEPATSIGRLNPGTTLRPNIVASGGPIINVGTADWEEPFMARVPLGLHQNTFRLITISKWSPLGFLYFPVTPSVHLPRAAGGFEAHLEQQNPLMHRSQENCQWRGTLRYHLTACLEGAAGQQVLPHRSLVFSAVLLGKILPRPCFVDDDTFKPLLPSLSVKDTFSLEQNCPFLEFTTPPGRWTNTHFGANEQYNWRTCPVWILLQFPPKTASQLHVRHVSLWVEPTIEYRHPMGGFPLLIPDPSPAPEYFSESTFAVG